MHQISTRWTPTLIATAALATLTACGGDSGSPPAKAVATGDTVTVPWNRATALAVTTNDLIANGAATIAVTAPPANGTAVVSGNSITYTPKAAYFGNDKLSYTLTVGNQTSTADVSIAVAAHMTLAGTVRDAVMPGAQVVLTIGGVDLPAVTADANGNYSVDVTTASPSDFISLKATGAGAQSNVVLSSLVGDAVATAAAATTDGTVSAAALPAANVTNVTTAEAVLTAQALGKTPSSSADIASVAGQFSSAQTIQMATAIKLVADAGVALPGGAASTLALVSDPSAYASFVTTQATTNATVFNATQAAVVADPTIAVAPPAPAAGAPDIKMMLTLGQGAAAQGVIAMTLKADHTALVAGAPVQTATWATDGSQITVTFAQPVVTSDFQTESDGAQWQATETNTGFTVRQLGTGTATVNNVGTTTFTAGPDIGKSSPFVENWITETIVTATQAFHDTDVAIGTEWAGVLTTDFDPSADYSNQDTLKFVDGTHVLYERTGITGTYAITAGSLVVTTTDGAVFSFTRMFTGPKGEERWLTTKLADGAPTWEYDAAVVKVTPGLSFTTASATNDYLSYVNAGLATGQFYIDLLADGTGGGSYSLGATEVFNPLATWTVGTDGTETLTRYYCTNSTSARTTNGVVGSMCSSTQLANYASQGRPYGQVRTWTLLATSGNNLYVMERLTNLGTTFDQYRVNVYTKTVY